MERTMSAQSRSKDGWRVASFKAARRLGALLALQGCVVFLGPSDKDDIVRDLVRARELSNVTEVSDAASRPATTVTTGTRRISS